MMLNLIKVKFLGGGEGSPLSSPLDETLSRAYYYHSLLYAGNDFGIWTGLAYPNEGVVLLAAVVTGGYHPFSEYIWSLDGLHLREENFPILYATFKIGVLSQYPNPTDKTVGVL